MWGETIMKLTTVTAGALVLIATMANAESTNNSTSNAASPKDRYFDAAHGPDDPHSVRYAGDYIGCDPAPSIRAAMIRERYK
jgi:hypothetical protein